MPASKKFPLLAFSILLLGGVATGFNGIFMRLSDVSPLASAFWRFALALPFLWAWALWVQERDIRERRRIKLSKGLLLTGFYFATNVGFFHMSLKYTTVSDSSLLLNFSPVFIALWMWKIHHTRFAPIFLVGMGMALFGATLLIGPNAAVSMSRLLGDCLALCAAVLYGAYQLLVKASRVRYSSARLMAWATTVSALTILPMALLAPGKFWPEELLNWAPLLGLTLIVQILGQATIAWASAHLPAALSSVSLAVMPLTATIAAWWLFDERLGPLQLIGGFLLLLGIFLSTRGYHHHNPPG
ncbi:DMT family transporter [Massilia sp. W12]|uniref:DMT family transporter n=1 Tax=Massilia sp. W12 TaxID=3126507 RepID=UPI0030D62509